MKKLLLFATINFMLFSVILRAQEFSIKIDAQKDAFYNNLTGPSDGYVFISSRSFLPEIGSGLDGDADLSARVWFSYDNAYLYCYAEIKDDIVLATSDQRYLNDCLELKLDPDPNAGTGSATANSRLTAKGEGDAENPSGVDNLNGSAHLVDNNNNPLVTYEDEDYARRLTDDGYALEFRIPFDFINVPDDNRYIIDRVVGGVIGMAINVGDNDGTARDNMIQWSAGHADAAHSNPALLGSVTFLDNHKVKLEAVSPRDPSIVNDSADVWYSIPTGVKQESFTAETFQLLTNYPNPFNPSTTIKFSVPNSAFVTLTIYNNLGQEVVQLISKEMKAGVYITQWNASGFSSGVYYYRLTAGKLSETKKLVLLK